MSTESSLTILVSQGRSYLDRQWDAFESQDKKIAGLFALATATITLVPTIVSALAAEDLGWRLTPFCLAAVAYLAAAGLHWAAYQPSEVHLIGNARAYYEAWLGLNDEDVLRWTLLDLAQRQEANELLLDTKATRMRFAATAVAFETLFLFVGVVTVAV